MSIEPDGRQSRADLAEALRRLRKAAGLSQERLAVRCAMSQSKYSRIESNRVVPSVLDVERVLKALKIPSEAARDLITLARQANVEHTSWRAVAELGLWRKQSELKALAQLCTLQRLFNPAIPSGLLHVPEYARAALSPVVDSSPARDVDKAVSARLNRQTVLNDPNREFQFVLTEQAVRWKRAPRHAMADQCAHMAELSLRPNIDIAIVPQTAEVSGAALNSFVIYDDRLVIEELFSGEVALSDPRDISHHENLFDFFRSHALSGERARALLLSARDQFM
nr:helix-turn-helix transcriptional regulator [Herbihabitans rhizosphaerae]